MKIKLNPLVYQMLNYNYLVVIKLHVEVSVCRELIHKLSLLQLDTYNQSKVNLLFIIRYLFYHPSFHQFTYLNVQKPCQNLIAKFFQLKIWLFEGNLICLIPLLICQKILWVPHEAKALLLDPGFEVYLFMTYKFRNKLLRNLSSWINNGIW